jgi:hypothetical protein
MALDAQPSLSEARSPTTSTAAAAPRRGRSARVCEPVRDAVRRRLDEAALAAAVRELSTRRHSRVAG